MKAALYDIFRKDLLGTPVWMESVEDLETAKLRVLQMADRSPGEYFVFSQQTKEIVSDTTPRFFDLVIQLHPIELITLFSASIDVAAHSE